MNHLHIMSGTIRTHVIHTGFSFRLRRDRLQYRRKSIVGLAGAARHKAGAVERPFFTTGYAHAHKVNPQRFHFPAPTPGIFKEGIPTVNKDIVFFKEGNEFCYHGIHCFARLDHKDNLPRFFQRIDQLFQSSRAGKVRVTSKFFKKIFRLVMASVINDRGNTMPCQISRQIGTHHGKADQSYFSFCSHYSFTALFHASRRRARLSPDHWKL